jgi:uncharacterized membrane protein YhaH (DUF805 family)
MNYEALFVDPRGRTSRGEYIGALITLLAALVFYYMLVFGPSGRIGMLVMLYPAVVLHARRLRDMGRPAWLLVAPVTLLIAAFWLRTVGADAHTQYIVQLTALGLCAGFVVWSLTAAGRTETAKRG